MLATSQQVLSSSYSPGLEEDDRQGNQEITLKRVSVLVCFIITALHVGVAVRAPAIKHLLENTLQVLFAAREWLLDSQCAKVVVRAVEVVAEVSVDDGELVEGNA